MGELEQKSREAWLSLTAPDSAPMPAGVALDMAQDACGDRDDAASALLVAASRWLMALTPERDMSGSLHDAQAIASDVRAEHFAHAESLCGAIRQRAQEVRLDRVLGGSRRVSDEDRDTAFAWGRWCDRVAQAIETGRAIVAAAHPTVVA